MPEFRPDDDESMLLATKIPIPDGSDSEMDIDETQQEISLSTPYASRQYNPSKPMSVDNSLSNASSSQNISFSPKSDASPLRSAPPGSSLKRQASEPMVEDAMRARAEQAQSAAERLLEELNDPEVDEVSHSSIPPSLLATQTGSGILDTSISTTPKVRAKVTAGLSAGPRAPMTPLNKNASIMRQAALFADSPVQKGRSTSLMDVLHEHKHQSGWWLKRMSRMYS
jgi:CLIP-associating protein 1/2